MGVSAPPVLQAENGAPEFAGMQTEDLRVSFAAEEILKSITLEARRGEILSIIGPAGAGKTTFLRCLNRMLELDLDFKVSGKVLLNQQSVYDREVQVAALRRKIGMVFSVPVTLPMTIHQNLTFGLNLDREGRNRRDERLEAALRAAYLWDEVKDRLQEPARNLSGGQQQRLCLARALTLRPEVLLLDEPCSGLDPISTRKIEEALQELKADLTVILVTNNVKQAARASDRTAFFLFGELLEVAATETLFTTPRERKTADYISGRFG
ncbi:MAG: phosphate ABC transporter ATP-binding protein [Acidobacteriia bacterium]|nr:phosphate ABC transporter ATP-binding protein [Terriglobia bacterium]